MRSIVGDILGRVIVWGLLIAFCFYVVRSWVRWSRGEVKLTPPRWRSSVTTVGFAAASTSLAVIIALGAHAIFTGGLPYYHPILMLAFRIGLLTALIGVLAALIGKGQLEKPTIISSLLCLLIWFAEALAQ
jgi:hypothetical protein